MPYKYKRRGRKKTYKRRKSAFNRKRSTAYQPRAAIADSQLVKMRYGGIVNPDAGAGSSASWVFSANSIFDPDRTGIGHQPLGHDEWANFYDHYVVIGSRITVRFMPNGDTALTNSSLCSITLEDDATASTTIPSLIERTGAVIGYMGTADGKGSVTLRKGFSAKKFFNKADVRDNSQLGGKLGVSNPAEEAYFHINVSAVDGVTNPAAVECAVLIEYICVLSERKNLVQS